MTPGRCSSARVLPFLAFIVIVATIVVAPGRPRSRRSSSRRSIALAAGLSSTAIGVYGGVLVPGLLLLGIDARFVAALSLFLQVLVIPLAAGSHVQAGQLLAQGRSAAASSAA